jgi:hypothetical protein
LHVFHEGKAVQTGQQNIKQRQIEGMVVPQMLHNGQPVVDDERVVTGQLKVQTDAFRNVPVVLDDQNPILCHFVRSFKKTPTPIVPIRIEKGKCAASRFLLSFCYHLETEKTGKLGCRGDRQKTSFLAGQPRFASRPLGSRAAKRTGKPPETGDPFRRMNRRSRNQRVKGCGP